MKLMTQCGTKPGIIWLRVQGNKEISTMHFVYVYILYTIYYISAQSCFVGRMKPSLKYIRSWYMTYCRGACCNIGSKTQLKLQSCKISVAHYVFPIAQSFRYFSHSMSISLSDSIQNVTSIVSLKRVLRTNNIWRLYMQRITHTVSQ